MMRGLFNKSNTNYQVWVYQGLADSKKVQGFEKVKLRKGPITYIIKNKYFKMLTWVVDISLKNKEIEIGSSQLLIKCIDLPLQCQGQTIIKTTTNRRRN